MQGARDTARALATELSFVLRVASQAARPMCGHFGHLAEATDPINQARSSSPAVAAGFVGRVSRA